MMRFQPAPMLVLLVGGAIMYQRTQALVINNFEFGENLRQGNKFASNRLSSTVDWATIAEKTDALTLGSWRPDLTFKSSVSYGDELSLTRCLGGRTVYIVGDSWAREKYKTLVRLLARESGEPVRDESYNRLEDAGRRMRHVDPSIDPHKEGCWFHECPGIDMKTCGRPGSDSYTFYADKDKRSINLHFQFKTYFLTPASDYLIYTDIARINPDIIIVDIGRWGPSPKSCQQQQKPAEAQYLTFLRRLNATSVKPVFIFDSGEAFFREDKDRFGWVQHADRVQDAMDEFHFPVFKIDELLNKDTAAKLGCRPEKNGRTEAEPGSFARPGHFAPRACTVEHGYAGDLMDEVVKLSMRHIFHLTHDT